ncbi:MAG: site-2 protease family protein [Pseudomonadota bacterium]|nr:site-2 protease family protein [Pseudomonadota bacterium]
MNELDTIIRTITVYAIPVLFAISLHEAAHGYVARYFGDPTASEAGRLSLNPARHIDPFGTLLLPLLLYMAIHVPFGYAKPVPVDFSRLRNPHKQMPWVAAAGPAANFAMALGWMIAWVLLAGPASAGDGADMADFFLKMAGAGVSVNVAMFVFNLIPIPPLDGGRIMTGLLPLPLARKFARIELYGTYVFMGVVALMYLHVLDGVFIVSIRAVTSLLVNLVHPLTLLVN